MYVIDIATNDILKKVEKLVNTNTPLCESVEIDVSGLDNIRIGYETGSYDCTIGVLDPIIFK